MVKVRPHLGKMRPAAIDQNHATDARDISQLLNTAIKVAVLLIGI